MSLGTLRRHDRGDIVLGWLVKLVVALSLVAVVCYDAISISAASATVSDEGAFAAQEAATHWRDTSDIQRAYDGAVAAATEKNRLNRIDPKQFRIEPDGSVHLTVQRTAKTLVVHRIGPIASWAHIARDASGRPSS